MKRGKERAEVASNNVSLVSREGDANVGCSVVFQCRAYAGVAGPGGVVLRCKCQPLYVL